MSHSRYNLPKNFCYKNRTGSLNYLIHAKSNISVRSDKHSNEASLRSEVMTVKLLSYSDHVVHRVKCHVLHPITEHDVTSFLQPKIANTNVPKDIL